LRRWNLVICLHRTSPIVVCALSTPKPLDTGAGNARTRALSRSTYTLDAESQIEVHQIDI